MNEEFGRFTHIIRQSAMYCMIMVVVYILDKVGIMGLPRAVGEKSLSSMYGMVDKGVSLATQPVKTLLYWHGGVQRIADLESRLAQASVDHARLKELEGENQALKAVKGIKDDGLGKERIMARVVGADGSFSIDRGKSDGVELGMVVLDKQGVLVGLVGKVSDYRSELNIPTDQSMRIPVRVVGEATIGVLLGDGSSVQLTEVLQNDYLNVGDVLVTTGGEGIMPAGLVVGQVTSLTGSAADVTKGARVELLAAYDSIVFVGGW